MTAQKSLAQLITMLEIFELLTTTKEYNLLASTGYKNTYQAKDSDRMDNVFKHIFCNFKSDIKLEEMASIANMNQQAFCRYFKSRTQKTLVEFVNNIRISHACKLISDGDYSITALAYECGFQSLSNFNRFFKEVKGLTPREYRKQVTVL
ncbi:helix-turn-helix domain-containing protein [Niabella hibiscisoli]|uniref:helix-turn-helix domain-containing protein n=1 Tax=Niabella hibiscisoli TaxID=1825928 RepID=UPI001F0CF325|nr:AraC family transcriptional regulator [Niabella hibiscisoli]MCH5719237.1 AraC family transcriptional regulator [Niabella hibiscisoli]